MTVNLNPGWTPERVALLKKLWLVEGRSGAEIARELGGITRAAVIGKLTRLKLAGRDGATRPTDARTKLQASKPKLPKPDKPKPRLRAASSGPVAASGNEVTPTPVIDAAPLDGAAEPKNLFQRGHLECCFPVAGAGAETLFCCEPTDRAPNWQYCAPHLQIMGRTPKPWERAMARRPRSAA